MSDNGSRNTIVGPRFPRQGPITASDRKRYNQKKQSSAPEQDTLVAEGGSGSSSALLKDPCHIPLTSTTEGGSWVPPCPPWEPPCPPWEPPCPPWNTKEIPVMRDSEEDATAHVLGETRAPSAASGTIVWRKDEQGKFCRQISSDEDNENTDEVFFSPDTDDEAGGTKKRKMKTKDNSWMLKESAPGGPNQVNIIPSFGGHVALRIWMDEDRGVLTCHTREKALCQLSKWSISDESALKWVQDSGLAHLQHCMFKHLDIPFLSAFVERWQPDTNTFHMPFGEMTIMLHDVYYILGLPVEGISCKSDIDSSLLRAKMCELLAIGPTDLVAPKKDMKRKAPYKGGGVLLETILERCRDRDVVSLDSCAQGFLLYLLGCTLFVDKSGDRARSSIHVLLTDLSQVKKYAWGAGCLAFLFRQMGMASRAEAKGICGCLTLLQAWIYEYFPIFRPRSSNQEMIEGQPRVLRWDLAKCVGKKDNIRLSAYRAILDGLTAQEVDWLPYGCHPARSIDRTLFTGCIRFIDIFEPYQPQRCLRQLGYMQVVPPPPLSPSKAYRPASPTSYHVHFPEWADQMWTQSSRLFLSSNEVIDYPPHATSDEYMCWYLEITHPFLISARISRPLNPESGDKAELHVLRDIVRKMPSVLEQVRVQGVCGNKQLDIAVDELLALAEHWRTNLDPCRPEPS